MADNRPENRKKNVTGSTDEVKRRGGAVGGGPVGNSNPPPKPNK